MKRLIIVLLTFAFTPLIGCSQLYRLSESLSGTHRAPTVETPTVTSFIHDLGTDGQVTFTPYTINGAPASVRLFVKNDSWEVASPGGWYEIPWATAPDGRATEYAVVNFTAQAAVVYNQPAAAARAIIVRSTPPGAFDSGVPSR